MDEGKGFNTVKGVNTAMEFNKYNDILFNKKNNKTQMRKIQSKKNKIGTCAVNKISLSCFDNKKFILDDGVHTLAFFHKDCKGRVC